ncbi:hypothetical protein [Halorientalis pallida]|uniref:Uncharacterized protein n=1 Tax=Halorientalis pallida TaxID=2479928 RepID=A0A498KSB4_9EURY|nr:hypothetical protein [Halorientalis pallida]RXK47296.1 hypothetical protein EAF64_16065 [Halorientalis pallida]
MSDEVTRMVESFFARVLLDLAIVSLILASIVEVIVDVRGMDTPEFLPSTLAGLSPSEPATALGVGGIALLVLGIVIEMGLFGPLPGGRFLVGTIAVLAFLLTGGFLIGEDEEDGSGYGG